MVNSLELYKESGLPPIHYNRWLKTNLLNMGQVGLDYYEIPEIKHHFFSRKGYWKEPNIYFLPIETAITICFMTKTEKAKKIKLYLQLNNRK